MSERETFIRLETEQGKTYRSTDTYAKTLRRIDKTEKRIDDLYDVLVRLRNRIYILETPSRQKRILDILKSDSTRSEVYFRNHISNYTYGDLRELIAQGKVIPEKRGHRTMYHLPKERAK